MVLSFKCLPKHNLQGSPNYSSEPRLIRRPYVLILRPTRTFPVWTTNLVSWTSAREQVPALRKPWHCTGGAGLVWRSSGQEESNIYIYTEHGHQLKGIPLRISQSKTLQDPSESPFIFIYICLFLMEVHGTQCPCPLSTFLGPCDALSPL